MSHDKLLDVFWHNVDPTDDGGQLRELQDRGLLQLAGTESPGDRVNPLRYRFYRYGCGRDNRLREVWGKDVLRGIEKK